MSLTNQQDEAYAALKEMVLTSRLVPGQKIDKNTLETVLRIGTTPIREAIIRLRREGLFKVVPQSGTYVAKINLDELYQGRFVRMNIEKLVITDSVNKITPGQVADLERILQLQRIYLESNDYDRFFQLDEKFHHLFYQISHKEFVWQWLQLLNLQFNRFRYLRLELKDLQWDQIIAQHQAIADAVKGHDKAAAEEWTVKHLHMVDHDVQVVLAAYPQYFTDTAAVKEDD
ncbi:MAG: GntR family transcriptional regulator [Schleiferilactobacillus perolens]|uniref:GntR family transcriptional regulator n=1 Tax=Schleiferilactobacillus perolens TaxID=100468 RepID=UPI0039E8A669